MTASEALNTPIEELYTNWRFNNASLLHTSDIDDAVVSGSKSELKEALNRAAEVIGQMPSLQKGHAVPLHQDEGPFPTNTYILWRGRQEQVGWQDRSFGIKGSLRYVPLEEVVGSEIHRQVRFWHPDYIPQPDPALAEMELPPDSVHPVRPLPSSDRDAFFDSLTSFVKIERETERENRWEEYATADLRELIHRGSMTGPFIPIARSVGANGDDEYAFKLAPDEDDPEDIDLFDDEEIYPNSLYIVDTEDESEAFPISVRVTKVDGDVASLQPEWGEVSSRPVVEKMLDSDQNEFWFRSLLNPVPYERRLKAIRQVKRNPAKRELITGNRAVEFTVDEFSVPTVDIELNRYQKQALVWADAADDIVCIHGPPGTGKTRTLTAYVKWAVSQGAKVLVTAHSNQAVDNILVGESTLEEPEPDTLHAFASGTELAISRVGYRSKNRVVQANYVRNSIDTADVVAATTSGAAQFDEDTFDVAVVDEATQASRPATAIIMNCAKKLILAGDHKQLPPYCADETMKDEEMHISLFEYLLGRYGDPLAVLLKRQYRMNAEIAAFPNEAFYDGKLETDIYTHDWQIDDLRPVMAIDIAGQEHRESTGKSWYNRAEAEAVAKQVRLLLISGVRPEDIGVISAYRGQITEIWKHLHKLEEPNIDRITVDTVDSFQGGEREAIVVSFVRSNSHGTSGFLEFPTEGPRRLNVALTRAKKRLVLIGNWNTLSTIPSHHTDTTSCADLYRQLFENLTKQDRVLSLR